MATEYTTNPPGEYCLSAAEFAALNGIRPRTVYERFCRTGSYFGVVPRKLANGRLRFPNVQVVRGGEA